MSKEKEIAERVAKKVMGGAVRVPYRENSLTNKISKLEIKTLTKGFFEDAPAVSVGGMLFDKEQLDTFIDTLKSAARSL